MSQSLKHTYAAIRLLVRVLDDLLDYMSEVVLLETVDELDELLQHLYELTAYLDIALLEVVDHRLQHYKLLLGPPCRSP